MMKKLLIFIFASTLICQGKTLAQSDSAESPIQFEASYIGDNINNLSGGIKKGYAYLGFASFNISFDTQKAKLWNGGLLHIHAANTHGGNPSADLIGDFQVVSNIEAGNHTYLQEIWYKQTFSRIEFTLGLQDLNAEIAVTEGGSLFLNSSFGIMPSISANLNSPVFPLTAIGFTTKWNISPKSDWLLAFYDGNPTEFEDNPYNLNWQYQNGDGILAISEFQQNMDIKSLPGTIKLGIFNHSHITEKVMNEEIPDSINHSITGGYFIADQKLWQSNNHSLDIFAQIGLSPTKYSINKYYLGAGINYYGLFTKNKDDAMGVAVAHVYFNDSIGAETSIELTYFKQLTKNIFIQPDIQYIINPSGTDNSLSNAFTVNMRFGFSF